MASAFVVSHHNALHCLLLIATHSIASRRNYAVTRTVTDHNPHTDQNPHTHQTCIPHLRTCRSSGLIGHPCKLSVCSAVQPYSTSEGTAKMRLLSSCSILSRFSCPRDVGIAASSFPCNKKQRQNHWGNLLQIANARATSAHTGPFSWGVLREWTIQ